MRALALSLTLLLGGCAEGLWLPALSLPWGQLDGLESDDGCDLRWEQALLGVPAGALLGADGAVGAELPGKQAFALDSDGPRTLGEIRAPQGWDYGAVRYDLGPVSQVSSSAYDGACVGDDCGSDHAGASAVRGDASADQRQLLRDLGLAARLTFSVACEGDFVRVTLDAPPARVECPLPEDFEFEVSESRGTLLVLRPDRSLRSGDQLLGLPWRDADTDGDGLLSSPELVAAPGGGVLPLALSLEGASCTVAEPW